MDKKITIIVLFSLTLAIFLRFFAVEVRATELVNIPIESNEIVAKKLDREAQILQKYLGKHNSPMQDHAQDFIDAANKYDLDWKMLPAIAGVESTFGKHIPGGYNAYGWGVYGTQAIYFNSWTDGIFTVARGLRENYLNKGLKDPFAINKVYAESTHWGSRVTFFMNDLEKFASQFSSDEVSKGDLSTVTTEPKIAAISASPVIR